MLGGFSVIEAVGLLGVGPSATFSSYWRNVIGSDPRCRHANLGRLVMITFFGWVVAHLGWGLFGFTPRRSA